MVDTVETAETPEADSKEKPVVPEARAALVKEWVKRVKGGKEKHKKAFEQMRECQRIARDGSASKEWVDADKYVVPVLNRHISTAVASLYARNPRALAKRKQKLMYRVWDGDPASLEAARQALMPPVDPATGMPLPPKMDPMTGQPALDPEAVALIQEVEQVRMQLIQYDRMGRTLTLCFQYFMEEQDCGYREQLKAWVRRAKTNGVAYVKLGFQRAFKPDPDVEAQIADATQQLAAIERLIEEVAEGEVQPDQADAERLRLLIQDLQSRPQLIAREGPVLSFPRSTAIIPDPRCKHLKTFAGARWVAEEIPMTAEDIKETYKVDVCGQAKEYTAATDGSPKSPEEETLYLVWLIEDKKAGQSLAVCDGYPDFLREPAEPDVKIERFWTYFPLVFNEVENEEHLFPPSDVWIARNMQKEYNSSRQGLSEHRIAGRPRFATAQGKLEASDHKKLGSSEAFSVIELLGMTSGENIESLLQRVPAPPIDPSLYETETVITDIQRSVGSQQADLGGAGGDVTATESSIAENSRQTFNADNIDDLDTALTALARAMGQLMLLELDPLTVQEIAGPGAVWPEQPPTREQINKDLILDIVAGSSGRPNKAAELANFERAMPYLVQLPGLNPVPLAKKAVELLDIDVEDAIVEGLPSITAANALVSKPAPTSPDPNAQGPQGADNAKKPGGNEAKGQPAFPGPQGGAQPSVNAG